MCKKTNEWVRHVAALKKSDVAVSRNGRAFHIYMLTKRLFKASVKNNL